MKPKKNFIKGICSINSTPSEDSQFYKDFCDAIENNWYDTVMESWQKYRVDGRPSFWQIGSYLTETLKRET